MATQRSFGTEISGNTSLKSYLSNETRAQIIALEESGQSAAQIASLLKVSRRTVFYTLKRFAERGDYQSRPKTGRPLLLRDRENRLIRREVKKNLFLTNKQLQTAVNPTISRGTLYGVLRPNGIRSRVAKKRPSLQRVQERKRLGFARLNYSSVNWQNVIFSDESSILCNGFHGRIWVKRTNQMANNPSLALPSSKYPLSVMVWGAISWNSKSRLIIMERDAETKGFTSDSYVNTLFYGLLPLINRLREEGNHSVLFQQDNAPIHSSKFTKKNMDFYGIDVLPSWPPNSPDLNPIEGLWNTLKSRVAGLLGNQVLTWNRENFQRLCNAIHQAWDEIPQSEIQNRIRNMEQRIEAVLINKGQSTRY